MESLETQCYNTRSVSLKFPGERQKKNKKNTPGLHLRRISHVPLFSLDPQWALKHVHVSIFVSRMLINKSFDF